MTIHEISAPAARRILFVSSTTQGGSGRSQRELGSALADRGREVRLLVEGDRIAAPTRRVLDELADASVRFDGGALGSVVAGVRHRIGRRPRRHELGGLEHFVSPAPENALADLLDSWRPDVVAVSSISRLSWRAVRAECRRRRLPTVLYLREAVAVGHLTAGLGADVLVANSHTLVADAARHGVEAHLVPSVVRVEANPVPPTREIALLVNPVATHGVGVVDAIATRRPDIPLVLQESWPLDPQQQAVVDDLVTQHRNVVFRAYEPDAGRILRDARLVLAPHRVDNRPRTVLEAQVNAVPVVATDHPGLVEAVGDGGLLIDRDAGGDVWAEQVGALWDDTGRLRDLGDAAVRHAARDEIRPDRVVDHFEHLMDTLVSGVPA